MPGVGRGAADDALFFFNNCVGVQAVENARKLTSVLKETAPAVSVLDPPATPALGACYIVANSATGEWAGKAQCLAGYSSGGWRYLTPVDGMIAYVKATGTCASYRAGAWEFGIVRGTSLILGGSQVVGSRLGAIAGPNGGTIVDTEGRTAINQVLAALRQHGLIES